MNAVDSRILSPTPTSQTSCVDDLRRGDAAALIPCLKQHQAHFVPLYRALLKKPGLKDDARACERFAEALFYASFRLLPDIVEDLLGCRMTLPAELNPENPFFVFNAEPGTTSIRIEDTYDVNQFGFEEAIYVAICEGHAQGKLAEAERIVRLILERAIRMSESAEGQSASERKERCLNNSGSSQCEAGYLDSSFKQARRWGLDSIVALLQAYVEEYGVSPDDEIGDQLEEVKNNVSNSGSIDELVEMLEDRRYRFLEREMHDEALSFAMTHRLEAIVTALLKHPRFDIEDMTPDEIVTLFSRAVKCLNSPIVEYFNESIEDFEDVVIEYRSKESESPIVSCLQSYLECRSMSNCPNPRKILRLLFELDRLDSDDEEEIQGKINVLKEEMKEELYRFDQTVIDVVSEYQTLESDSCGSEDLDELEEEQRGTGSEECQAGDSYSE